MMHRDTGAEDEFEVLCSIPDMKVSRFRMRKTIRLEKLTGASTESLLIPMAGKLDVIVHPGGEKFRLLEKDVCYVPKDTEFTLIAEGPVDFLWAQAPAEKSFPAYVKRFADVRPIESGAQSYRRRIFTSLGENEPANRFIVGFVEGESGNWTSFPPHRHDGKPELYVYYGLGRKFGVQVVADSDEKAFVVRDGDSVAFERGYHPNVSTPGVGMNFVWIISADPKSRNLAVDLHPEFKDLPMGQTHLTTR